VIGRYLAVGMIQHRLLRAIHLPVRKVRREERKQLVNLNQHAKCWQRVKRLPKPEKRPENRLENRLKNQPKAARARRVWLKKRL
jgi:hypothetical protein